MTSTISEENPLSLSKGCFVHRKKPLQRTKNSKSTSEENEDELWSSRKVIYQNLWQMIAKEVNDFQETVHGEVLDTVVSFVLNSYSRSSTIKNVIKEIPTAALIMGVNMPDHSAILQLLFQRLLHSVTNHVVSLHSRDCKTLSAMIQKFVASIMKAGSDDLECLKRQDFTFHSLSAWYQDSNQRKKCIGKSPQKKRKMSDHSAQPCASTPIVILLEDLEAFNCTVLTDFILLCRNYLDKIPIVLVMMIATATVTIHSLLPQQASSCLAIETFYSIPPTEYLTQILQIIINPSVPFNLGPRVIQLLVDVVLFHDFSVANLIHMLKYCLFEHFYTSATTMLCCDQSQLKDCIENLGTSELAAIKELPSFRRYLKNCQSVPGNNRVYKDLVFKLLEELHTYQYKMFGLVGCLHVLVKDLPSHPLGKQMREIYVLALEKNISETQEYTKATKILGMLSRNELEDRLLSCQSFLDDNEIQHWSQLQEVKKKLQEFVTNLHHIKEMANSDEMQRKQKQSVVVDFGKMTSRSQLKEKLKDLAQNRKSTEFENCRRTIVDFFTSLFRELVAPSCFPLHEILYFNDAGRVKQHIMAAPRSAICKALVDPAFYLQCTCCSIDDYSQICSSMVDTCVAYKLHLEYGRLINLYDWLQSFKMVKMANDSKEMKKVLKEKRKNKKQDGHDLTLQAQFVQAVSELQFLGFIKPTKRKTDHVARLTWGTS